VGYITEITK